MISRISGLLILAFIGFSLQSFGQTEIIVYDGYSGIYNVSIQDDTARVMTLLPRSPAEKKKWRANT